MLVFCYTGNALLEDDDKVFHLVRPADEMDDIKSKRGSMKDKGTTKAITEIYLTRLLSMKVITFVLLKRTHDMEIFEEK